MVSEKHPEVKSLRDVTEEQLLILVKPVSKVIYNRCSYVLAENLRVLQGCEDLQNKDLVQFGKRMFKTHEGLQNLYEVSCPELDCLVEGVRNHAAVFGARMMGGGFGGGTINLVKENEVADLVNEIAAHYRKVMKKDLKVYI